MNKDVFNARFKDAPWYKSYDVVIGGLGGIGSWTSMLLGRSGHRLYLFDDDSIDNSNIGGQLYQRSQVGVKKNVAASSNVQAFTATSDINLFERFTEEDGFGARIMISCFDNMAARKVFFEKWLENMKDSNLQLPNQPYSEEDRESEKDWPLHLQGPAVFIDGRLEAETGIIYCVRNEKEAEKWLSEWFPDDRVADKPCTFAATSHNAAIIAGLMTAHLNNVITNHVVGYEERVTPYKTTWALPTFLFEAKEMRDYEANRPD